MSLAGEAGIEPVDYHRLRLNVIGFGIRPPVPPLWEVYWCAFSHVEGSNTSTHEVSSPRGPSFNHTLGLRKIYLAPVERIELPYSVLETAVIPLYDTDKTAELKSPARTRAGYQKVP